MKKGQVLIITIVFLAVVMIILGSMFARVAGFLNLGARSVGQEQALHLAEAGIERTLWKLNATAGACGDCQSEYTVGSTGTFVVSIQNKSDTLKTITSTGYTPNSTSPRFKQTIKTDVLVSGEFIAFNYAIQVGNGGVYMNNSSIVNGNIYSNKPGVSITGGNNSKITGDAFAVGTVDNPPIVLGQRQENQPPSQIPSVDYQLWKDQAAEGGTVTCTPTCTLTEIADIGPKKYEGNVTFAGGSIYTMQGPLYITGNVRLDNGATIKIDEAFGSLGTVMITDGTVFLDNNARFLTTSANPKGYILVVSTSTNSQAIYIDNNGVTAVFYALEGGAFLANNAGTTSLVAKQLTLDNNAVLTYDTGLAGGQFTGGPGGSWQIKKGTYKLK